MSTATASPTRSRAQGRSAAPTASPPAVGQLSLAFELPAAIEAALLAAHAQGQGTTSYHGMRAAAFRAFGVG